MPPQLPRHHQPHLQGERAIRQHLAAVRGRKGPPANRSGASASVDVRNVVMRQATFHYWLPLRQAFRSPRCASAIVVCVCVCVCVCNDSPTTVKSRNRQQRRKRAHSPCQQGSERRWSSRLTSPSASMLSVFRKRYTRSDYAAAFASPLHSGFNKTNRLLAPCRHQPTGSDRKFDDARKIRDLTPHQRCPADAAVWLRRCC